MKKIKVMTVFGTRPEAIKMVPLIKELEKQHDRFESVVTVTAQHREMLDQVLTTFEIRPDYDLNIMKSQQSLSEITTNVLLELQQVMTEVKPDVVLVHGDTTTTFATSISAFYHQIKVGHVEAGLRTWDMSSPFPEEMNRQATDVLADFYFTPTTESANNLLKENHLQEHIYITGNTAIDTMKQTVTDHYSHEVLAQIKDGNRLILLTMHRRENQGEPMADVFKAIRQVVDEFSDVEVVYPVHLSPAVQKVANDLLSNHDRIHLIEPLEVVDFHNIAARSHLILSDSGGVQEEAPSLGVPVLVLRETTERPEGVAAGTLKLVGTNQQTVMKELGNLLTDEQSYQEMSGAKNPYGDGKASERIVNALAYEFGLTTTKTNDFNEE